MYIEVGSKYLGGRIVNIAVSGKKWVALSTMAPCLLMSSRHQTKAKMVLEMSEQDNFKLALKHLNIARIANTVQVTI